LSCKMRTPAANMTDLFLANLWTQNILQKLSAVCRRYSGPRMHSVCCYHFILVISHNHHELNFRLLAATFFRARRSCMLPLRGLRFQLWFKISYPCFTYGNNSVQKLLTFCLVAPQQFFCDRLASCSLLFAQLMRNPLCSDFSLLQCLSHVSENGSGWHVCFMRNFFTWFASIFLQQGADDNHRCVVRCCYWSPASWVVLDAYPTFTETRCLPWYRATIPYTLPANFMYSIMSFGWVFSSQSFNFNVWSLVTARDLTPMSFFFNFKTPFCRTWTA
jgi:hypothetical protein